MVDDLKVRRKRRISKNYGDLYVGSCMSEREKPMLARRLRQVLRGFRKADIIKLRPTLMDTSLCDIVLISEHASAVLEMEDNVQSVVLEENCRTMRGVHSSPTYERIQALFEAMGGIAVNENTVRGLIFLAICTRALLYDREAERAVKLWFDALEDHFILYINPENGIDESLDPSIKAMVLARTLGVQLEVTDENEGITCYKLVASAIGEFLYEVRKLDEDDTENESTEEL